jgi:hypothetical protein
MQALTILTLYKIDMPYLFASAAVGWNIWINLSDEKYG